MKRTYKFFWIILIALIPLLPSSGWNFSIDVSDVGFNMNQYRFCFTDMDSTYLPLFLTNILGGCLLKVFGILHIPAYIGMETAWAAVCFYLCFLSYRLYVRYREDALILPALAFAMVLAKCNFHFFIYNTAVAFMALTGLYFLIRAVNDKKSGMLFFASAFFMLAAFCKISSILQFAVFAVLFYDFYRKKDVAYFVRQVLWCVVGVLSSFASGLFLMYKTCGIGTYFQMVADMFFYAGNSNDGHTIGNMVVINFKGTVRGILLLAVLYVIYLVAKKVKSLALFIGYGMIAMAVLLLAGAVFGADRIAGLSMLYRMLGDYLNAVAVIKAMLYVCVVLILKDKEASEEFKTLAFASGMLAVLMPIGSNVGITHLCNEAFFVLPYIAICIGDRMKKAKRQTEETVETEHKLPDVRNTGRLLTVICAIWCVGLTVSQSFYMTKAYLKDQEPKQQFTLDELRGIRYDTDIVQPMEEVVNFIKSYGSESDKMVTCGAIPILHYLTGRAPYITGCGGWIETDYITAEEIEQQLEESVSSGSEQEAMPLVVFNKTALDEQSEKTNVVLIFVKENFYQQVFANGEYEVYAKDKTNVPKLQFIDSDMDLKEITDDMVLLCEDPEHNAYNDVTEIVKRQRFDTPFGSYSDGWIDEHAKIVLTNGESSKLTLKCYYPGRLTGGETCKIKVNGRQMADLVFTDNTMYYEIPAAPYQRFTVEFSCNFYVKGAKEHRGEENLAMVVKVVDQ